MQRRLKISDQITLLDHTSGELKMPSINLIRDLKWFSNLHNIMIERSWEIIAKTSLSYMALWKYIFQEYINIFQCLVFVKFCKTRYGNPNHIHSECLSRHQKFCSFLRQTCFTCYKMSNHVEYFPHESGMIQIQAKFCANGFLDSSWNSDPVNILTAWSQKSYHILLVMYCHITWETKY